MRTDRGRLTRVHRGAYLVGATRWVTYVLDLADVEHRIGVEYDGSSHLDRNRLRDDRARHNWLESHGWRMRYFTDRDLYRRADYILRTVRAARTRSR